MTNLQQYQSGAQTERAAMQGQGRSDSNDARSDHREIILQTEIQILPTQKDDLIIRKGDDVQ